MARVQACYTKGYAMKKAGQIQSYRIYNTGEGEPTFEVRTLVNGKPTWRLASALPTGSLRRDAARPAPPGPRRGCKPGQEQQPLKKEMAQEDKNIT